ncbi:MAG: DUF2339 domain-containing protein [Bacteroidota bacterium]|jgi:uncharacterized membrane protein
MEILLSLLIIILVIIFNSSQNKKLELLETKLEKLEDYLKFLKNNSEKNAIGQKTEDPIKVSPLIQKAAPPVVVPEKKQIEPDIPKVKTEVTSPEIPKQKVVPPPQIKYVPQETWYDKFRKNNPDLEKFVGENLVSKIGIAILVIGITFFVKFAIDKDWINEIARVGIGILCGVIVLGFANNTISIYNLV